MTRLTIALSLSASMAAAGISVFALLEIRSRAPEPPAISFRDPETGAIRARLDSLEERLIALEARRGEVAPDAAGAHPPARRPEPSAQEPASASDFREQIEALSRRLESLEDGETIARLAESGERLLVEKDLRTALAQVAEPSTPPAARLSAVHKLLGLGKTHRELIASAMKESGFQERDLLVPVLEMAQDAALDPEFRVEAVYTLAKVGSKDEGLRQPLLDLFAFDQNPEVRVATISALGPHLGDPLVQQAILQASAADRHESVRAAAAKYLPKIQSFDKRAIESGGAAPRGAGK